MSINPSLIIGDIVDIVDVGDIGDVGDVGDIIDVSDVDNIDNTHDADREDPNTFTTCNCCYRSHRISPYDYQLFTLVSDRLYYGYFYRRRYVELMKWRMKAEAIDIILNKNRIKNQRKRMISKFKLISPKPSTSTSLSSTSSSLSTYPIIKYPKHHKSIKPKIMSQHKLFYQ